MAGPTRARGAVTWFRLALVATVVVGVALAVWVGAQLFGPGTAPAVWRIAPGADVDEGSTRIDVLVSRAGCNNGVTGEVLEPDVEESADEVVVTFRVSPGQPSEASCPGNVEEPWTVVLTDPLGGRRLVDGDCRGAGDGVGAARCDDQGIRLAP